METPKRPSASLTTTADGRKVFVRREPLLQRLSNAPGELSVWLSDEVQSLDWDDLQRRFKWMIVCTLNVLFVVFHMMASASNMSENECKMKVAYGSYSRMTRWLCSSAWWAWWMRGVLYGISVVNAMYAGSCWRKYHLFERRDDDPVSSPNLIQVDFDFSAPAWTDSILGHYVWYVVRRPYLYFYGGIKSTRNVDSTTPSKVWQLRIWNPPIISTALLQWFSPVQLFIGTQIWNGSTLNLFGFILSMALFGIQSHALIEGYAGRTRDKQILHSQVQNEYNMRMVNPRVFYQRRDACVMTDDAIRDHIKDQRRLRSEFSPYREQPQPHPQPHPQLQQPPSYYPQSFTPTHASSAQRDTAVQHSPSTHSHQNIQASPSAHSNDSNLNPFSQMARRKSKTPRN